MTKMTPKEIDKLEASREMDALVAGEVMEWSDLTTKYGCLTGNHPNTEARLLSYGHTSVPEYSTSISAAWKVIDKFNKEGKEWELVISKENCQISNMNCEGQILTGWNPHTDFMVVDAPTAPLAICRFALKVVLSRDQE